MLHLAGSAAGKFTLAAALLLAGCARTVHVQAPKIVADNAEYKVYRTAPTTYLIVAKSLATAEKAATLQLGCRREICITVAEGLYAIVEKPRTVPQK